MMKLYICFSIIFAIFVTGCTKKEKAVQNIITIAAVGDVNFGSNYPSRNVGEKNKDFFIHCKEILQKADISFCNLETVLCRKGDPAKSPDGRVAFVFRAPTEYASILADAGFDVVSIANNHIRDFGIHGENETKKALRENGIQFVSRNGNIASFIIRETRILVVGFSSGYEKRSIANSSGVFDEIKKLSEQCDILIVSFHAGAEGEAALHIKNKTELFLGENRGNVVLLAHGAIDNGADLVLMHGPHVPRAIEVYKEKFITYSLGNFINYGWNLKGNFRISPLIWVEISPDGSLSQAKIYSFVQKKPGFPEFDRNKTAFKLIRKLTEEDFGKVPYFLKTEDK
ncbi:MAG: CapA family protein [bacterium]|nr:CapA family protein [bacterium]